MWLASRVMDPTRSEWWMYCMDGQMHCIDMLAKDLKVCGYCLSLPHQHFVMI